MGTPLAQARKHAEVLQRPDFHLRKEAVGTWARNSAGKGSGAIHAVLKRGLKTPDLRCLEPIPDVGAAMGDGFVAAMGDGVGVVVGDAVGAAMGEYVDAAMGNDAGVVPWAMTLVP